MAPRTMATRPTQDRVREALFSILTSRGVFEEALACVIDLYAGTGALGLEALSRGAERAVFVEKARDALEALRENVETLGVSARIELVGTSCEKALSESGRVAGPFALAFLDPPYADLGAALEVLRRLVPLLAPGATVVLEHGASDDPQAVLGLTLEDTRVYGDTILCLYGKDLGGTTQS